MTTALSRLADQLDEVTAEQRAAQDEHADAVAALAAIRHRLADASAAGEAPSDDDLDALAVARDRVERAELHTLGLARKRRRITDEQREQPAPPLPDDPRGIVRVVIAGKAGRHVCNQPTTGRPLLGGQLVDVTPDDATFLAEQGYAELVGPAPEWWPSRIPATGQVAAAR